MSILNSLVVDVKSDGFSDIYAVLSTSNHGEAAAAIKSAIMSEEDVAVLKAAAVKFSGVREFFFTEDRLVDLIGDDEYDDFADQNGL